MSRIPKEIAARLLPADVTPKMVRDLVMRTRFGGSPRIESDQLGSGTADATTFLRGDRTWVAGGGGGYTDEQAQDAVGSILTDSATIDFAYNDAGPSITGSVIDGSIGTVKLGGDITAAGKALLDDADAAAQRTTLGAAAASHTHDDRYYTDVETDSLLNNKANIGAVGSSGLTMATARVLARTTAGTGAIEEKTAAEILAFLGAFSGITIQSFTTGSGTYTPTAGMKSCLVIAIGAGGGGGGADTGAGGSADVGVGAGGGAGGLAIGAFSAATIGAGVAYAVGTGGTAGSATNGTTGGTGGGTTFGAAGALLSCNGGVGGTGSGATTQDVQSTDGGAGGTAPTGTFTMQGASGQRGLAGSADGTIDLTMGQGGDGAGSFWGGGGKGGAGGTNTLTTDVNVAGANGIAYGAGGGGALCLNNTTGAAGGQGANGAILIVELT